MTDIDERWGELQSFINRSRKLIITTHLNPDGDAIGSEIAMATYLQHLGKDVIIVNSDRIPDYFRFLAQNIKVSQYDQHQHDALIRACDGCFVVDTSEWKRLGEISNSLKTFQIPIFCLDHHLESTKLSEASIIDDTASCTGELIYDFLSDTRAQFTIEIVDALYTCVLTDTGSFKFSNTSPKTHQMAANLLAKGARFQHIFSEIYESDSKARSWLKGHLLASMKFDHNDKLAWFVLSQDLLRRTGAEEWEAEGFSELPRFVKGIEISVMFTETKNGFAKASFRSKGRIPVSDLAKQFGGGGHKYAAGATLDWPLQESIQRVIGATGDYLKRHSRE